MKLTNENIPIIHKYINILIVFFPLKSKLKKKAKNENINIKINIIL